MLQSEIDELLGILKDIKANLQVPLVAIFFVLCIILGAVVAIAFQ